MSLLTYRDVEATKLRHSNTKENAEAVAERRTGSPRRAARGAAVLRTRADLPPPSRVVERAHRHGVVAARSITRRRAT
jgi:hypothetical protein